MLISDKAERDRRSREKVMTLLMFLKQETYSDFSVLKFLFEFKSDRPLYRLLAKVEKLGLIQKHVHSSRAGKISIWGITQEGLAAVILEVDNIFPPRFEPSKLKGWTLDHHLDNQLVHLTLSKKGCTDWINGDRNTFLTQFKVKHRPDGVITLPNGKRIAIETERSLKTKARYQQIIASHLKARTENLWFYVFYIVPDEQKKRALMLLFDNIKYVVENGQHVVLEAKHRGVFRFYTQGELLRINLANQT
ncbi:MobC family replication-relaxation protein [Rouxiella sp. T17]|uniref:MobC family replication-relaxation protein n=1 Tax=Rouxiella sp. T17 TaxID=3085684 RepID=UPI002FC71EA2